MRRKKNIELENGVLSESMDINAPEFTEFQAILLNKAKAQSKWQKINVELVAIRIQMEDYAKSSYKSHPKLVGDFLKYYLDSLNIRQNKFADYLEIEPSNLNKVIKGERQISSELALKIGKVFGLDPLLLLEIQIKNEFSKLLSKKNKHIEKYSLKGLLEESAG